VIAGAVRHADDQRILDALKRQAAGLDDVEFLVSAPRHEILALLSSASIGLHTMKLEHFGIAVVEFMAASLVVVAHASGGPLLDIVGTSEERGFVATDAHDYATKLASVIEMDASSRRKIGERGRAYVAERFSDSAFGRTFVSALAVLLNPQRPPAAATVLKGGLN
jgi:alpha-1,2-mannosyltransferase